jgi:hypothetical protein
MLGQKIPKLQNESIPIELIAKWKKMAKNKDK